MFKPTDASRIPSALVEKPIVLPERTPELSPNPALTLLANLEYSRVRYH